MKSWVFVLMMLMFSLGTAFANCGTCQTTAPPSSTDSSPAPSDTSTAPPPDLLDPTKNLVLLDPGGVTDGEWEDILKDQEEKDREEKKKEFDRLREKYKVDLKNKNGKDKTQEELWNELYWKIFGINTRGGGRKPPGAKDTDPDQKPGDLQKELEALRERLKDL